MLPGTLMRQKYADKPPCVEMRNTKLHGVAYPDFRNCGNVYPDSFTPAFFGHGSQEYVSKSLFMQIYGIGSSGFYVTVLYYFGDCVVGWLGHTYSVAFD